MTTFDQRKQTVGNQFNIGSSFRLSSDGGDPHDEQLAEFTAPAGRPSPLPRPCYEGDPAACDACNDGRPEDCTDPF